jgi:hypothetical protein
MYMPTNIQIHTSKLNEDQEGHMGGVDCHWSGLGEGRGHVRGLAILGEHHADLIN